MRQREQRLLQTENYGSPASKKEEHSPQLRQQQRAFSSSSSSSAQIRLEAIKAKYDQQLDMIRDDIKLKVRENKRLYEAFKSIRESNESLKLKVSRLLSDCGKFVAFVSKVMI